MTISTYQELQAELADWLGRDGEPVFTGKTSTLIQLAENRMWYGEDVPGQPKLSFRPREMLCRAQAIMNEEFEWLPTTFLEMESVQMIKGGTDWTPLTYKDTDEFVRLREKISGKDPAYYTVYGEQIRFWPAPTGTEDPPIEYELVYWGKFEPLTNEKNTNTILTNYPDIYLFGSLMMAEAFVMNDARIATWRTAYDGAVRAANGAARRRRGVSAIGPPQ